MATLSRYAPTAARVLLGLIFFVFGLNGFFQFIPQPKEPPPPAAMEFMGALMGTGYMFPLLKSVEVVSGALLLANRFVPLALTLLAANVVNIVAFHVMLAPSGLPIAIVVLALELYLAWTYRASFRGLFVARVRPASQDVESTSVGPSPHVAAAES